MHWKKSLLGIHKILRLFVKTLAVDEKHYLITRNNFTEIIRVKLSQKQKTFSEFFLAFLKAIKNFQDFPKKDGPHFLCISENTGSKKYG